MGRRGEGKGKKSKKEGEGRGYAVPNSPLKSLDNAQIFDSSL